MARSLSLLLAAAALAQLTAGERVFDDAGACSGDLQPFLDSLFSNLGNDCDKWFALWAKDGEYFHQHSGYANYSGLQEQCKGYAKFCPGDKCKFKQNGPHVAVEKKGKCAVLAPYLWSEIPAKADNYEPHTGWEYMVLTPNQESSVGYLMNHFAEIETTYSVQLNWANPGESPDQLIEDSLMKVLKGTASKGECDHPIASVLTEHFDRWTPTIRQQGDATVLAAGGKCQVAVPYALAMPPSDLMTGRMVFTLKYFDNHYGIMDIDNFPDRGQPGPESLKLEYEPVPDSKDKADAPSEKKDDAESEKKPGKKGGADSDMHRADDGADSAKKRERKGGAASDKDDADS